MILALLVAVQTLDPTPLDLDLRPPHGDDIRAAENRARNQVPRIVRLCREGMRSGDLNRYIRTFADRHGLSSYGRVTLSMNCDIYRQGTRDGAPTATRRTDH